MEFLELATWLAIGKIIVVDILLAGDNAVVIGMAVSKLKPDLQKKAILWGTFGAIALRFLFATIFNGGAGINSGPALDWWLGVAVDFHSIVKRR